jgi:hypothetical protein
MKFILPLVLLFLIASGCSRKDSPEEERTAVMNVVDSETKLFYSLDYDKWKECFLDTSYFAYAGYDDGDHTKSGIGIIQGYKSFTQAAFEDFNDRKSKGTGRAYQAAERTDLNVQISGSLAYVTFSEIAYHKTKKENYTSNLQLRVLQKRDGKWKICHMGYYSFPEDVKRLDLPLTYWGDSTTIH